VPITPRTRSAATLANDKKILDAAVAEAHSVGLDSVGFGAVGKRAGVTTGAMYARYVDARDMLAVMWTERLSGPTLQLLSECIERMAAEPGRSGADLAKRLASPPKAVVLGVEALMAARRIPELEEVMVDDVAAMLRSTSVSVDSGADGLVRLRGALALATGLGCVVNNFWERETNEWSLILDFYSFAASMMTPSSSVESGRVPPAPIVVETDSDLRNVLIRAVGDVVARSGVEAATVARIARRARMTTGAVYTIYASKDELLLDAMEQMLASAASDVSTVVRAGAKTDTVADATANVFALALAPERRPWRQFRLETYLSARTDKSVAAVVRKIQKRGLARYRELYAEQGMSEETVRLLSRVGQNQPLGFTIVEQYVPDFATFDFRAYADAMLVAQKLLGR